MKRAVHSLGTWPAIFIAIAALLLLALLPALRSVVAGVEGRLFPVVAEAAITRLDVVDDVHVRVWGRFKKLRDCSFERLEFRLADSRGAGTLVDLEFEEKSKVRPRGPEEFGPWILQLTERQLTSRAYAVVYHRCHPLWLTETVFLARVNE